MKRRAHECVESESCESHDFRVLSGSPSRERISLSFAVKLKNVEQLFQVVNEVSDMKSANFGKHLSFEEVGELTSNSEASDKVIEHLLKFVDRSKITSSFDRTFIRVETSIKTAQKILKTKYHSFKSKKTGEVLSRTLEYELPNEIFEVVDYVFPTVQFPSTMGKRAFVVASFDEEEQETSKSFEAMGKGKTSTTVLTNAMTPKVLAQFYNITSNMVTNNEATQSVFATGGQSFSTTDLTTFQKNFNLVRDRVDSVQGPNLGTSCASDVNSCVEASLDVQYLMSTAQNARTTFWSTEVTNFANWIESVSSSSNPPLVHSISYGQYESAIDINEQQRFSQEAARLGARGVTIVVATGDDGVSLYGARSNAFNCGFNIPYPANVPFVLSVGATMGPETGSSEVACQADKGSSITSGGGFSTIFPQPSYQSSHVQSYLTTSQMTPGTGVPYFPTSSMFTSSGRAIPDVAIAGNNYQVIIGGRAYTVSGTSASAPVFAGIISLANNARLNAGKSSLGFVNPILYELFNTQPQLFNDITTGDNRCTAQTSPGAAPTCCQHGFKCAQGWDPVTGLGSVNVGRLIEALLEI